MPPLSTRHVLITDSDRERFLSDVIHDTSGCHFMRGKPKDRYASFRASVGSFPAHRVALTLKLGRSVGRNLYACHHCDVPGCVNPEHLFEGHASDNAADAVAKGRMRQTRWKRHPEYSAIPHGTDFLHDRLVMFRRSIPMSVGEVSLRSGVGSIYLHRRLPLRAEHIAAIAAAVNIDPRWLEGGHGRAPSPDHEVPVVGRGVGRPRPDAPPHPAPLPAA